MKYAMIENSIVVNIVEINPLNAKDFPSAINVEKYPVCVGDMYDENIFYRNGEEVLSYEILEEIAAASYDPDNVIEVEPIEDEYDFAMKELNLPDTEVEE